jgi:hypothetical protein
VVAFSRLYDGDPDFIHIGHLTYLLVSSAESRWLPGYLVLLNFVMASSRRCRAEP